MRASVRRAKKRIGTDANHLAPTHVGGVHLKSCPSTAADAATSKEQIMARCNEGFKMIS
jgi:hypothetical protein